MNKTREERIIKLLKENDIGALIFWRPDELVMMLGYLPLWGLSFLVYTIDGEKNLFVPELEPKDILPKEVIVRTYPWGIIDCNDPWEIFYEKMKCLLGGKNLQNKAISFIEFIGGTAPCRISGEQPPLPIDLISRLKRISFGGFKEISKDLIKLYTFKTQDDINGIRHAHKVGKKAVEAFYEVVQPGLTEAEVANFVESAVQNMIGIDGIQFSKAWPMIQSGENAYWGGKYNLTTGKKLMESEMVMMEIGICVDGYWCDITRTAAVGAISEYKEKLFHVVLEAQQRALTVMRPGVPMAEVDGVSRKYIAESGLGKLFNHGLGHQVGFRYHDPGHTLSPMSIGILEEGMVLTVEPGIYGKEIGVGIRIEDNVLITKDGFELLSDYPRDLLGNVI